MSKLISTFKIRFDDATKAEISELKNKLDEVNKSLNARDSGLWSVAKKQSNSRIGQIVADAISKQVKEIARPDGLLRAMQAVAANDAPQPELKQMGQWVFEGRDEKLQSAAVDGDGRAFLYQVKKLELELGELKKHFVVSRLGYIQIDGVFDTTNWQDSAIDRETINDVEYLSETVPTIQAMEASEIIDDECDWLSESAPQITQADMQLIFIKNLATTLIQRMHSMNRFSEDEYQIGGDKLIPWDIVIYEPLNAYAVAIARPKPKIADFLFFWKTGASGDEGWNTDSEAFKVMRTITESELPAFRAALEACYA